MKRCFLLLISLCVIGSLNAQRGQRGGGVPPTDRSSSPQPVQSQPQVIQQPRETRQTPSDSSSSDKSSRRIERSSSDTQRSSQYKRPERTDQPKQEARPRQETRPQQENRPKSEERSKPEMRSTPSNPPSVQIVKPSRPVNTNPSADSNFRKQGSEDRNFNKDKGSDKNPSQRDNSRSEHHKSQGKFERKEDSRADTMRPQVNVPSATGASTWVKEEYGNRPNVGRPSKPTAVQPQVYKFDKTAQTKVITPRPVVLNKGRPSRPTADMYFSHFDNRHSGNRVIIVPPHHGWYYPVYYRHPCFTPTVYRYCYRYPYYYPYCDTWSFFYYSDSYYFGYYWHYGWNDRYPYYVYPRTSTTFSVIQSAPKLHTAVNGAEKIISADCAFGSLEIISSLNDFEEYQYRLIEIIARRWEHLCGSAYRQNNETIVVFYLSPDGYAKHSRLFSKSVDALHESNCVRAITESSPFSKWTAQMKKRFGTTDQFVLVKFIAR